MISRRNKDLQRYFDGDLGDRGARKVRERVETCPEDQQRLGNLESMRSLLRHTTEEAVDQADFGDLWSKVRTGIAGHRSLTRGEKVELWLRRYGLVAASAAAALVLALFLLRPFAERHDRNDCDIESLDVDPGTVSTIFTIYSPEKDDKTTVIWLNEEPPEGDKD
jgi:anti-sigma factor RsiW